MAFDAAFTRAVVNEISKEIGSGSRVEKLFQPTRDSLLFVLRCEGKDGERFKTRKLLIDGGTTSPRICFTDMDVENPKVPPMFCMLLRKHLGASKLVSVSQMGFERVVKLTFECRDELGYLSNKYIYAELMGKFSNIMFCDSDDKIISAFHLNDLSVDVKRPVIVGVKYELPPAQEGKISPFCETKESFLSSLNDSGLTHTKFIQNRFFGLSPLVVREIVFSSEGSDEGLWYAFRGLTELIEAGNFTPVIIKSAEGAPIEYSFKPIRQYEDGAVCETKNSFSELIDEFFLNRSRAERIKQRASDILKLITNAETRLNKRLILQREEFASCAEKESFKRIGDLITSNIYMLKRGMTQVEVVDYYDESCPTVTVALDSRLTPAQNAQRYYKRYNKSKSAEVHLKEQIEQGEKELVYLDTVFDSLTRAETEADLNEIRRELYVSGYASKMKNFVQAKQATPKPLEYRTSGGWRVLCGKNNSQNEYITHKVAVKGDIWFHVKDYPGSHVVLLCDGEEPDALDYTEAANIAAVNSKAPAGQRVTVDYTRIKNIKKPPNAKPGFVTFSNNYSAYVIPEPDRAEALKVKK